MAGFSAAGSKDICVIIGKSAFSLGFEKRVHAIVSAPYPRWANNHAYISVTFLNDVEENLRQRPKAKESVEDMLSFFENGTMKEYQKRLAAH